VTRLVSRFSGAALIEQLPEADAFQ
jgi:hypothetical protein